MYLESRSPHPRAVPLHDSNCYFVPIAAGATGFTRSLGPNFVLMARSKSALHIGAMNDLSEKATL